MNGSNSDGTHISQWKNEFSIDISNLKWHVHVLQRYSFAPTQTTDVSAQSHGFCKLIQRQLGSNDTIVTKKWANSPYQGDMTEKSAPDSEDT